MQGTQFDSIASAIAGRADNVNDASDVMLDQAAIHSLHCALALGYSRPSLASTGGHSYICSEAKLSRSSMCVRPGRPSLNGLGRPPYEDMSMRLRDSKIGIST